MSATIYTCETCKFTFERTGDIDSCPDCGKPTVRVATTQEVTDHLRIKAELAEKEIKGIA